MDINLIFDVTSIFDMFIGPIRGHVNLGVSREIHVRFDSSPEV